MTPRNFIYLAIAAALSVLFAVVSFASNNQWGTGRATGEKLFPTLVSDASRIAIIEVKQGDSAVVLERTGGSWNLKNRDGYPADPVKVRTLLVGLAEADLVEGKTRRPDRYAVLELENPADKGAKSRIVRLLGEKGSAIGEVIVGKKRQDLLGTGKSGTYVRKPGDPQTWLASADIDAPVAVKDWLKTSVYTTEAAKISRITIAIPGQEALQIAREVPPPAPPKDAKADSKQTPVPPPASAKLQFTAFPPVGKKLKDAGAAETVARALASIDMEDVRKLDTPPSDAGVSTVKLESEDGLAVTLQLRKDGDATWLSLAASGAGEAKKTADDINQRAQGWEFKIPAYKADSILKKRADLLDAAS